MPTPSVCVCENKKKPEGKITKQHITNRAKITTRKKSNDSNDLLKKILPAHLCVSLFQDEPVLKSNIVNPHTHTLTLEPH